MRICFAASEIAPLAKTGGLADVANALPRYLHDAGHDVRLFMPLYSSVNVSQLNLTPIDIAQNVELRMGTHTYWFSLLRGVLPGVSSAALPIYMVQCPQVFDRPMLYTNGPDEHLRFLVFQRAVLESCQRLAFAPQIVHCNDWHTALLPVLLKSLYAWDRLFEHSRTVMSIHNIGYQGDFPSSTIYDVGGNLYSMLSPSVSTTGHFNWLLEGIRHADRVTTVSPTYAQEICTPEGAHGLVDALRARTDGIVGILNGVDYLEWNPATDRYLAHPFSARDMSGKQKTKAALLERFHLPSHADRPLLGIVSRMTSQKGFDLLFDVLPEFLISRNLSLAVLGSGEPRYEDFFFLLQQRFPERVFFTRGYSDEIAHLIEAASDMFLMPSMYEPCGLNQMYSLKYGTVPIVRRTGGLADSVQMWDAQTRQGTGVVFNNFDAQGMRWALHTALDLFRDQDAWQQMVRNGMAQDFSWEAQGREYEKLYTQLTG